MHVHVHIYISWNDVLDHIQLYTCTTSVICLHVFAAVVAVVSGAGVSGIDIS